MTFLYRRTFLAGFAAAAFAPPALAQTRRPPKPGETVVIDGKTVHLTVPDQTWKLLNSTKVTSDRKKGVMLAAFPEPVKALDGKPMQIAGFILPLEATPQFERFLLTKTNFACGFCPPPLPTEVIEVKLGRGKAKATLDPVKVRGRLELVASSEESVFYRLHDAAMA
jgi:hypothetical protein